MYSLDWIKSFPFYRLCNATKFDVNLKEMLIIHIIHASPQNRS